MLLCQSHLFVPMKVCRVAIIKQTNAKGASKEIKQLVLAPNHYCSHAPTDTTPWEAKHLLYMVLKTTQSLFAPNLPTCQISRIAHWYGSHICTGRTGASENEWPTKTREQRVMIACVCIYNILSLKKKKNKNGEIRLQMWPLLSFASFKPHNKDLTYPNFYLLVRGFLFRQ